MPAKLSEGEINIYAAIGHAQTTWAALEHELCRVFCETVNPLVNDPSGAQLPWSAAEDAFWAIRSFEPRLDMADAALERLLGPKTRSENAALLSEWTRTSKRIAEKSRKRNAFAHGSIWKEQRGSDLFVGFAPFFNQAMAGQRVAFSQSGMYLVLMSGPPKNLWTAQQIDAVRKGFDAGIIRLRRFHGALQAHNRAVYEREVATRKFFESHRPSLTSINNPPQPPPSGESPK